MKVLGVRTFKKYVVLEVPDPKEKVTPTGDGGSSRTPDWEARGQIAQLADQNSGNMVAEWVYSDYYKEATVEEINEGFTQEFTQEQDSILFSNEEWFDL